MLPTYYNAMHNPFACFISIRRMNCYLICLLNYSRHIILEKTYISNITSFPVLSVFMFTDVRMLLFVGMLNKTDSLI